MFTQPARVFTLSSPSLATRKVDVQSASHGCWGLDEQVYGIHCDPPSWGCLPQDGALDPRIQCHAW